MKDFLCVKITKTNFKEKILPYEDLLKYEILYKWKSKRDIDYVVGIYDNMIQAVYKVSGYDIEYANEGEYKGERRNYYPYGELDIDLTRELSGRNAYELVQGKQNPVSYHSLEILSKLPILDPSFWQIVIKEGKDYISTTQTLKEQLKELVRANHNLVLTGAPGTGKTYLAKEIAKEITEGVDGAIGFVQFHSSYDYTDFVEGLRPFITKDGQNSFKLQDGIFKDFCKRAAKNENQKQKYVFIIDEINRAEPSRVLGELFFAIEPGYRGVEGKVKTQYANLNQEKDRMSYKTEGKLEKLEPGYFYIPENVFIIGTMNDIDRNVDSMDFAMRRRFVWKEILASETTEMLDSTDEDNRRILTPELAQQAKNRMTNLNNNITEVLGSTAFHIGASYFLKLKNYSGDFGHYNGDFGQLWDLHLKPLLSEYLRGMPDSEDKLKTLKNSYDGIVENQDS